MTETPSTPVDPGTSDPGPATVLPVEMRPEAEPRLEASGELEEPTAEIHDAELARLLTTPAGLQGAIEAVLFTSPEALSPRKIGRVLGMGDLKLIQATIGQLQTLYDTDRRGMQIVETAGGYQMATREAYADLVLRLRGRKRRATLSPAALETLAIVAYRQPIIRAEIEAVRGVESSGMLRNLMDMGLVEIVGRKDVLGRPAMYGTSASFLQSFGLKTLAELPPIAELKRRLAEQQAEAAAEEQNAPEPPAPTIEETGADSAVPESAQPDPERTAMDPKLPLDDDEPLDDEETIEDDEDDIYEIDDDEDDFEDEEIDDDDLDDDDIDDLDEEDIDEDEDSDDEDRPGR